MLESLKRERSQRETMLWKAKKVGPHSFHLNRQRGLKGTLAAFIKPSLLPPFPGMRPGPLLLHEHTILAIWSADLAIRLSFIVPMSLHSPALVRPGSYKVRIPVSDVFMRNHKVPVSPCPLWRMGLVEREAIRCKCVCCRLGRAPLEFGKPEFKFLFPDTH